MRTATTHQWTLLRYDKWLLSCLTWIPLLLAFSIWWIFSHSIASNLPIGVVDFSHSQMSRELVRHYDATSMLKVSHDYTDVSQAKADLITGDIYAYVIIPTNFDKDVYRQSPPQVSAFYNSQYILVGKLINSALLQAQGTFNAKVDVLKNLSKGDTTGLAAMGKAVPVRTQITALFNKNVNYAQFLVSAIVPALWQIIIVVTTIMILAANYRSQKLTLWLGDTPVRSLFRTLAPYVPIFLIQGSAFLVWFYMGLDWPMNGSFLVILFAQIVTIPACMIMGAVFFFLTLDPARAMSFAGAFTAPSFAFMGITFPVTDMNVLAQLWRSLLPITHYIEVQVSQVSYGASMWSSVHYLLPMLGYLVPAFICIILIKRHQKIEQLEHRSQPKVTA